MAMALVMAWLLQAALATMAVAIYRRQLERPQPWPAHWPPALVLVPVRGDAGLEAFLVALAAQDHPSWRVVFAVEAADDPATPALAGYVAANPTLATLVVAGATTRRGQKVHNLLAALAQRRAEDAVVVTLDADTVPPPGLLRALLRPLATGQAPIATGYRWTVAGDRHPASGAVAAIDQAIATLPPLRWLAPCWGGATAIRADVLGALDLPALWDRAIADDLSLMRAARRAGLRVYAPLTVRPVSPVRLDWPEALAFGTRQYRLVRLHAPGLWWFAVVAAVVPLLGGAAAVERLARGDGRAGLALLAVGALAGTRWWLRRSIAAMVASGGAARPAAGPLTAVFRVAASAASVTGRSVVWAGRRYRLARDGAVVAITPSA